MTVHNQLCHRSTETTINYITFYGTIIMHWNPRTSIHVQALNITPIIVYIWSLRSVQVCNNSQITSTSVVSEFTGPTNPLIYWKCKKNTWCVNVHAHITQAQKNGINIYECVINTIVLVHYHYLRPIILVIILVIIFSLSSTTICTYQLILLFFCATCNFYLELTPTGTSGCTITPSI